MALRSWEKVQEGVLFAHQGSSYWRKTRFLVRNWLPVSDVTIAGQLKTRNPKLRQKQWSRLDKKINNIDELL